MRTVTMQSCATEPPGRRRGGGPLSAAALGLVLLAACSASSSPATRSATGARTTTTTRPSPSSSSTAPTTSTTAAVDRCRASSSQIAKLEGRAATGHLLSVYSLKNSSGLPCRVAGYPGVALLDPGGRILAQAQGKAGFILPGRPPAAVTLAPGQVAYFAIESTSVCGGDDAGTPSEAVQVTLPDDTAPAVVADQVVVCSPANVLVSPVRATQDDITRR